MHCQACGYEDIKNFKIAGFLHTLKPELDEGEYFYYQNYMYHIMQPVYVCPKCGTLKANAERE